MRRHQQGELRTRTCGATPLTASSDMQDTDNTHWLARKRHMQTVLLGYLIVQFQAGKHWIFKAHIDANQVMYDGVCLVGLEGRRDGESSRRVSVQNVHKLLFLNGSYHTGATFGVNAEVLAWNDPTATALAKSLLMNLRSMHAQQVEGEIHELAICACRYM